MRRLLVAILLVLCTPAFGSNSGDIQKVLDQYVAAWMAGDADAVMRLLTSDSVLIPGVKAPLVGADAIRNYWWPPDGPKITLTRFENVIGAVTGTAELAVVRGTQVIEWTSGAERWRTKGNFVTVLRRTDAGWRIAMQVAASSPSERVQ
jgi:uncharacterized protein (TIGR02246 family)